MIKNNYRSSAAALFRTNTSLRSALPVCEGLRNAFAPRAARDGSGRQQRDCPGSRAAGTVFRPASAASAAKARSFSCAETKYVGVTGTSIVLKSEGGLRIGTPRYFKSAAINPTPSLDTRDTGVFMQIHAAKIFIHCFVAASPCLQPLAN